ncbi:lactosylceramide 4-alpha-galactosyltransferase [Orussus abietinus]|uniref:lactosylceramide 4-alpha-galactosyltransferase n=1 Tax=Orussus abietinus TaxID=222816 RepID=UPI000626DCE6|nr:lactosylceramide 4-alpha-galactosyltransferase [Orussus abietinus]
MRKRLAIVCAGAMLLLVILSYSDNEFILKMAPFLGIYAEGDISCYDAKPTDGELHDFHAENGPKSPIPGRNIFFHETSCFGEDGAILNPRQACAVESAARMNPSMMVFLFYINPLKFSNSSAELVRQLLSYKNVRIRRISVEEYVKNTPLEKWYASGALKRSRWPRSHMSDILRYLTLFKYGGIYLDLDVVVTTSLERLENFAGAESWEYVAAGVMSFGAKGLGRKMAADCLQDLKQNFRGDVWGNNGPGVITRTLQKICATTYARDMTASRCNGFTVYPPSAFYPIHFRKWKKYFDTVNVNETMKALNGAMAIHVWNKLSKSETIRVGSNAPYALVAQKHCPKVYENCGEIF